MSIRGRVKLCTNSQNRIVDVSRNLQDWLKAHDVIGNFWLSNLVSVHKESSTILLQCTVCRFIRCDNIASRYKINCKATSSIKLVRLLCVAFRPVNITWMLSIPYWHGTDRVSSTNGQTIKDIHCGLCSIPITKSGISLLNQSTDFQH